VSASTHNSFHSLSVAFAVTSEKALNYHFVVLQSKQKNSVKTSSV
jgi:hypothetical protein